MSSEHVGVAAYVQEIAPLQGNFSVQATNLFFILKFRGLVIPSKDEKWPKA